MNFLFVIGAPKCGTSSFFGHLISHPRLVGTDPKETYSLLEASHPLRDARTLAGLDELVEVCEERLLRDPELSQFHDTLAPPTFVEATTHNLYSARARTQIASLGDRARAIALLRQPSQRILSSFRYTQQNLARIPQNYSFAEYVDALLANNQGAIRSVVRHPASAEILANELDLSDYAKHLERWLGMLGRERVRVMISEDYFLSPRVQLDIVLPWLDLEPMPEENESLPERKNQTRHVGLPGLQRLARTLNRYAPRGRLMRTMKASYFRMQASLSRGDGEDYSIPLRKLDAYFEPRMNQLAELLGSPIDAWGIDAPATQSAEHPESAGGELLMSGMQG